VTEAHNRDWGFFYWAGAGFLIVFGMLALLSIGAPFFLAGLIALIFLATRGPNWPSQLGFFAGAGAVCIVIAALSAITGNVSPASWALTGIALVASASWSFWRLRCRPGVPSRPSREGSL
jgi:hypothetical protein